MKDDILHEFIKGAFAQEKAVIIRNKIEECLDADKITLDFAGITKFTALFFNFSTGYILSLIGPENYDNKISLINLSALGQSMYESSYNNAVKKYESNKNIDGINVYLTHN